MKHQQLYAQQQLMQAIFSGSRKSSFDKKGLAAYQANLLANATRAIEVSFPVTAQLIGDDALKKLTKDFLMVSPPITGNWSEWGEGFSSWLAQHVISDEYAYLSDCAALDWQLHQIESGSDFSVDSESYELLASESALSGQFILNPHFSVFSSAFPIADIWAAHQTAETPAELHMQNARHHLQHQLPQHILIWRKHFKAQCMALDNEHFTWLTLLQQQQSLGGLLQAFQDQVPQPESFSFQQWLPFAIEQQIIIGFHQ